MNNTDEMFKESKKQPEHISNHLAKVYDNILKEADKLPRIRKKPPESNYRLKF